MILHLILYDILRSPVDLFRDIVFQLRTCQGLLLSFRVDQVRRLDGYDRIFFNSAGDMLSQSLQFTDLPVADLPVVLRIRDRVILDLHCSEVTDEVLVLKFIQAESVPFLEVIIIVLHKSKR